MTSSPNRHALRRAIPSALSLVAMFTLVFALLPATLVHAAAKKNEKPAREKTRPADDRAPREKAPSEEAPRVNTESAGDCLIVNVGGQDINLGPPATEGCEPSAEPPAESSDAASEGSSSEPSEKTPANRASEDASNERAPAHSARPKPPDEDAPPAKPRRPATKPAALQDAPAKSRSPLTTGPSNRDRADAGQQQKRPAKSAKDAPADAASDDRVVGVGKGEDPPTDPSKAPRPATRPTPAASPPEAAFSQLATTVDACSGSEPFRPRSSDVENRTGSRDKDFDTVWAAWATGRLSEALRVDATKIEPETGPASTPAPAQCDHLFDYLAPSPYIQTEVGTGDIYKDLTGEDAESCLTAVITHEEEALSTLEGGESLAYPDDAEYFYVGPDCSAARASYGGPADGDEVPSSRRTFFAENALASWSPRVDTCVDDVLPGSDAATTPPEGADAKTAKENLAAALGIPLDDSQDDPVAHRLRFHDASPEGLEPDTAANCAAILDILTNLDPPKPAEPDPAKDDEATPKANPGSEGTISSAPATRGPQKEGPEATTPPAAPADRGETP